MRKVTINGQVQLCLFAAQNIEPNTELRYDYGVPDLPWRKKGVWHKVAIFSSL